MSVHDPGVGEGDCGGNAAPYVLGALTQAEHEAFAHHLASCAVCREEVGALQAVASSLPAAVPQLEAPPELKKRVMAAVHEDAERARARQTRRTPLATRRRWRPALVPAGIALATTIALIAVLVSGGSSGGSHVLRAQVSAPGASASVLLSGGHAQLTLANMPQSAPGRVYEVWIERGGAPSPTDTLFTISSRGSATIGVPGSIAGVKEVLVTSEPLGGSSVPTTAPVVVAKLT